MHIKLSDDMKIFILTIPVYIIIGLFCYDGILSLFSILDAINDGYSLVYTGNKLIFLVIITYVLWLFFYIFFYNYINFLAEIMIIIFNVVILIKGNRENAIMHRS